MTEAQAAGRRSPEADAYAEAVALLGEARARGIALRTLGGLAIRHLCPSAARPPLQREYKDIDLIGLSGDRAAIEALLRDLGYQADASFNLLSGHARLYFLDPVNGRQLDVFLDRMEMCHTLELADRLELYDFAITPTDLLLSKLQVVQTNERDLKDAAALLSDCELDADYIAALLAQDWGWWRTATEMLERVAAYVAGAELPASGVVEQRIAALRGRIDEEPKGRRWKLRARVGERMRWYELPEEDHATG